MRRLAVIVAFALFLTLPLCAQRGGGYHAGGRGGFAARGGSFSGHPGVGGHPGFRGGHVSPSRSVGAMHRGFAPSQTYSHGTSFHQRSWRQGSHRGFRGGRSRFRTYGLRNNCYGYGCYGGYGGYYYPWLYSGYYDPFWYSDHASSYDEDREREINRAHQMDTWSRDEQRARDEDDRDLYRDPDAYEQPRSSRERDDARQEQSADPQPSTVLVFRDQHKQEVQNYAIVGQTLWAFSPERNKIPLANLDLAATTKANDERGIAFRAPTNHESQ